MGSKDSDDRIEGDVSGQGPRTGSDDASPLRMPPDASKRVAARQRAGWFNRSRGAPPVRLAHQRRPGQQRVVVKLKSVAHSGGAGRALMRHALYVERDDASGDGRPVEIFDRDFDIADATAFVARCEGDRRHFRVIVSPEHGAAIGDLKPYARDLMGRIEQDLHVRIDWIAAAHRDTGRAHLHVLMRGRDAEGANLVIPTAYIAHGFRERAEALATQILGPRTEPDRIDREVGAERFTELDRALLQRARNGELGVGVLADEDVEASRLVQRLNRLEQWGLARRDPSGAWRLDMEFADKLIRRAERRDRDQAAARLLVQFDLGLAPVRTRELEQAHSSQRVKGRLVGFERLGYFARGPQLIGVEGVDGQFWTARIARLEDLRALAGVERGAIVELERVNPRTRASDRTIWEIAQANALTYSAALHRKRHPEDRDQYIKMHERRLHALRRDAIVSGDGEGNFYLPEDYLSRAAARETLGGRESARVRLLDPHPLERQVDYRGPTWLDRLADGAEDQAQIQDEGFGREARLAWRQRQATLEELGLGKRRDDGFYLAEGWRDRLLGLETQALFEQIERDSGRVAHFAREGERVEGVYVSRIRTAEQTYALIERDQIATLTPWRVELDRALNQHVAGQVKDHALAFAYGPNAETAINRALGLDLGD
jgi:type IV secretory pathway VirD2 relaxase